MCIVFSFSPWCRDGGSPGRDGRGGSEKLGSSLDIGKDGGGGEDNRDKHHVADLPSQLTSGEKRPPL